DKVEELLARIESMRPGELSAMLDGHRSRFRARLAAARGRHDDVEASFKAAGAVFREYGVVFWLAATLADHGEWLVARDRAEDAEPLLIEAREIFERLAAAPSLARLDA